MIVTGFYTPNYRPLAERLSRQLDAVGANRHFYAHEMEGGWDRQLMAKPLIVLKAMCDFPDQTIVLMDVDCHVHSSINDLDLLTGDVALAWRAKVAARRSNNWPSTRVVVWRQTEEAHALANAWLRRCRVATETAKRARGVTLNDERCLALAISQAENVTIQILPDRFAAPEVDEADPEAVIVHESAHDEHRLAWSWQKAWKAKRRRLVERITGKPYRERKYGVEVK